MNINSPYDLYMVDLVNQDTFGFQFVPSILEYNPESSFAAIKSIGRNNPFYHYTGSEDTIRFELDYVAEELNREDVIMKCRWVESLSKADGYNEKPHEVKLIWGASNLFKDARFIVVDAPYQLKRFHKPSGMFPVWALQQVTLKRVTDTNLLRSEILW